MKVKELIEILQNCNLEDEVRLATQPNYPFQNYIDSVLPVKLDEENIWVVFISEGDQVSDSPYLPHEAATILGWG